MTKKQSKLKQSFYNQVSKEINRWINQKFPKERKVKVEGIRGPSSRFSNDDLIEIALEVKKSLRGEKINYHMLETITGIGRQTWVRRVKKELNQINEPIIEGREWGLEENIEHINISFLIEKYGHDRKKLTNQLYYLEETIISYYKEIKRLKKENDLLLKYREENQQLLKDLAITREEKEIYQSQYYELFVSSWYPGLRKKNIRDDLIKLDSNLEKNTNIKTFEPFFTASQKDEITSGAVGEKRNGKDLVDNIKSEFADLFND